MLRQAQQLLTLPQDAIDGLDAASSILVAHVRDVGAASGRLLPRWRLAVHGDLRGSTGWTSGTHGGEEALRHGCELHDHAIPQVCT